MSLSIGIVGLPNVGKSTLFKALTKNPVDIANYPFCTIDPNVGVVPVPDARLEHLSNLSHSAKVIPATIEFVDIAGLVSGAHKGEGLGNKFLSHIREVDAICEVVREFQDDSVIHVNGRVDPKFDQEVIRLELVLADLEVAQKRLDASRSALKAGKDKKAQETVFVYEKVVSVLAAGQILSSREWNDEEKALMKECNFLTLKPFITVFNVSERELSEKKKLDNDVSETKGTSVLPLCLKLECELSDLSSDDSTAYLKELGISQTGLDKLIVESYRILQLITYFTTGEKETRAWTITQGTKAPQAAGKIHSDFEEGFICAETVSSTDLLRAGSWITARENGMIRTEGKEYIVKDGDVMVFRFQK
jgi:GTP-binding protein YchF